MVPQYARCSPLKLNVKDAKEAAGEHRSSIYSSTSWKLMPNDLGQPFNGKIRNNCRPENDISDYKSKRAMSRVRPAAENH